MSTALQRPLARPPRPRPRPATPGADPRSSEGRLPALAVVIPALDEQAAIGRVVAGVPRTIPGVGSVLVVVVDDGSRDGTRACALAAGADAVVSHARNRGLVAAFRRGADAALSGGADLVVQLDGDGQHDPADIVRLVEPLLAGEADLVVGARSLRDPRASASAVRRHGNRLGAWCLRRAAGVAVSDATSGYRAYTREALQRLNVTGDFTYTVEALLDAAHQRLAIAEVPIAVAPRAAGTSRMTARLLRYIRRAGVGAVRAMVHRRPLRAYGLASALAALAAAGFAARLGWGMLGQDAAHLPSLVAAPTLFVVACGLAVAGMLSDAIRANRRLLEDALHRLRCIEHESAGGPVARWEPHDGGSPVGRAPLG